MLEGKAAVQRDPSKLEMWFDGNLMGFRQRPSLVPGKGPPCSPSLTGPADQKAALQGRPQAGRGTPNFCGGQIEHKSAVRPCGRRAQLNTVLP